MGYTFLVGSMKPDMGRFVAQKRTQKIGYPLWMAPNLLSYEFYRVSIICHRSINEYKPL